MLPVPLPSNIDSVFERYKFHRIRFVYRCDIPEHQSEEAFALCKQVAGIIRSKLPPRWWVMAYGVLPANKGVDVVAVSRLNQLNPSLIHSVVLK